MEFNMTDIIIGVLSEALWGVVVLALFGAFGFLLYRHVVHAEK
jgi:nitrate reductase NapE component